MFRFPLVWGQTYLEQNTEDFKVLLSIFLKNKSMRFEKVEICSLKYALLSYYFGLFLTPSFLPSCLYLVAIRKHLEEIVYSMP